MENKSEFSLTTKFCYYGFCAYFWLRHFKRRSMSLNNEKVKLIFGLKLKQLRQDKGIQLSELADRAGFSVSYLNEIEKGKKYPKADKIFALARAIETDYDTLVSMKLSKKLEPIEELLN